MRSMGLMRALGFAQPGSVADATGTARPRVVPPGELGISSGTPVPVGLAVELDARTSQLTTDVLFGGSPARVLRLSGAGAAVLTELRGGAVRTPAGAVLARRLTDAGLAHPRPMPVTGLDAAGLDVTVVVPVRDRAAELDRCLAAAGTEYPVLVVDDGSADPAAVAAVCSARGARLLRRPVNGGPGAARNTALPAVRTEFVAFLDSDCVPPPGWIADLAGHFADPLVAAVAPRIVATAPPAHIGRGGSEEPAEATPGLGDQPCRAAPLARALRIAAAVPPSHNGLAGRTGRDERDGGTSRDGQKGRSARVMPAGATLDLGDQPGRVAPMTRVAYVPTAALVVRRGALGGGFDEALRYGEDVDLVWRLVEAGWRIRYEPRVQVPHAEPATRAALLARRFRYGTSAAPLTRRHPGAVAPLVLQPWPTITMTALLARRPAVAAAAFGLSTALLARRLTASGLPARGLVRPMANGVRLTWLGTGRWCGQFAAPAVSALLLFPGGRTARVRWGRRLAAASLLAGPPLAEWAGRRDAGLLRLTALTLADQAAYGAGVYAGCLRERLLTPVLPAIAWQPVAGLRPRGPSPPGRGRPRRRRPGPGSHAGSVRRN